MDNEIINYKIIFSYDEFTSATNFRIIAEKPAEFDKIDSSVIKEIIVENLGTQRMKKVTKPKY